MTYPLGLDRFRAIGSLLNVGLAIAALLAATDAMRAGTIVVGSANIADSSPFGGSIDQEFQQVYSSSYFTAPITIQGIDFYNTLFNSGSTSINPGNFAISLSDASANWNTLSSTPANNIGTNNTLVFSGSLAQSWAFGDTLRIALTTPFVYTPGSGNLLLDVVTTGQVFSGRGDVTYFDSDSNNPTPLLGELSSGQVVSGYGLVTGFETSSGQAPEPRTLTTLSFAFIGGYLLCRRRSIRAGTAQALAR